MKKGKFSNVEKFAIAGMLQENKSLADIAKALERTEEQVLNYVGDLEQKSSVVTTTQPVSAPSKRFNKLMGKKQGISIMTKEASELGDESKKSQRAFVSRTARNATCPSQRDEQ